MPEPFFPKMSNQEIDVVNNDNQETIDLPLPGTSVPQTGGEILQEDQNYHASEPKVYTRRKTHHHSRDQSMIPTQSRSLSPSPESSELTGKISVPNFFSPPISVPNLDPINLDVPIALRKGI